MNLFVVIPIMNEEDNHNLIKARYSYPDFVTFMTIWHTFPCPSQYLDKILLKQ